MPAPGQLAEWCPGHMVRPGRHTDRRRVAAEVPPVARDIMPPARSGSDGLPPARVCSGRARRQGSGVGGSLSGTARRAGPVGRLLLSPQFTPRGALASPPSSVFLWRSPQPQDRPTARLRFRIRRGSRMRSGSLACRCRRGCGVRESAIMAASSPRLPSLWASRSSRMCRRSASGPSPSHDATRSVSG